VAKVPKFIGWLPVTEIKEYCFYRDETIQEVMIPDTVKKIGENAFRSTGIKSITIPASVPFGYQLPEVVILFQRIDKKVIEIESEKLKAVLEGNG